MGIDWKQGKGEKGRIAPAIGQEKEGWIWEPIKIDKRGRTYSPVSGGAGKATILRQEVYRCGFCRGTGEKPKGAKCPVCKAKGQVSVKPPAIVCAYCKGRGEERPRSNVTCTACGGKGFVSVIEPVEKCPHCRGAGAEPTNKLPCIVCRGKGVVTVKKSEREGKRVRTLFQSLSSGDSNTKELVTTKVRPSGSEREVLVIIQELGEANTAVLGRRMGISPAYVGHLCNSLIKGGCLCRTDRSLFALTEKAKEVL
jgi:RecJ-like exonuclease